MRDTDLFRRTPAASSHDLAKPPRGIGKSDFVHRLFEQLAIFRNFDGFTFGADHFDAAFVEHARVRDSIARLSAVWPPTVGSSASGRSRR